MLKSSFREDNNYKKIKSKLVDEEATNKSFRNQAEHIKARRNLFFYKKEEQKRMSKRFLRFPFVHKLKKTRRIFFKTQQKRTKEIRLRPWHNNNLSLWKQNQNHEK
jgi:hypothetical protein